MNALNKNLIAHKITNNELLCYVLSDAVNHLRELDIHWRLSALHFNERVIPVFYGRVALYVVVKEACQDEA